MILVDLDGELPTILIGAGIGALIGGGGSIISDIAKGKKVDWKKAGKNALKGGAAGAIIGTGVGAVGALSAAGASATAVNTAVAATVGASYRAGADIVTSVKNKEVTISSPNRYLTSGISGSVLYHSFAVNKGGASLGIVTQLVSDIVAGEISPLETYTGAGASTVLMAKFAKSPSLMQALFTAVGTDLTQMLEQVGGVENYRAVDYISGPVQNIIIGYLAKSLNITFPNQYIEENEFVAILDGALRRIKGLCDE